MRVYAAHFQCVCAPNVFLMWSVRISQGKNELLMHLLAVRFESQTYESYLPAFWFTVNVWTKKWMVRSVLVDLCLNQITVLNSSHTFRHEAGLVFLQKMALKQIKIKPFPPLSPHLISEVKGQSPLFPFSDLFSEFLQKLSVLFPWSCQWYLSTNKSDPIGVHPLISYQSGSSDHIGKLFANLLLDQRILSRIGKYHANRRMSLQQNVKHRPQLLKIVSAMSDHRSTLKIVSKIV